MISMNCAPSQQDTILRESLVTRKNGRQWGKGSALNMSPERLRYTQMYFGKGMKGCWICNTSLKAISFHIYKIANCTPAEFTVKRARMPSIAFPKHPRVKTAIFWYSLHASITEYTMQSGIQIINDNIVRLTWNRSHVNLKSESSAEPTLCAATSVV